MITLNKQTLFLSAIAATFVTACNTLPENPNYEYSTKYEEQAPAQVTYASSTQSADRMVTTATSSETYQDCRSREKNRELIGAGLGGTIGAIAGKKIIGGTEGTVIGAGLGGTAGYGIGDKMVSCEPVQSYAAPAAPTTYAPSVAAQTYPTAPQPYYSQPQPVIEMAPTDQAYSSASTVGTPGYEIMNAETVAYDYSENMVSTASETMPAQPSISRTLPGAGFQHVVVEGDTVYSLSRNLCAGLTDVQNMNGLGNDYAIRIGDTINLPASRC